MGLFGGKNSFFNKPLGKNSDASRVASAVLAPARSGVNAVDSVVQGNLDQAKNYTLGMFAQMNPATMAINSSSSLRKWAGSSGLTDQFVSTANYSNKLASGKNLNWNEIRGFAGDQLENLAYAGAIYGGYAAYGAMTSPASSLPAYASKTGYLGVDTSFAPGQGISSVSQFGTNPTGYLSGSSATAGSTGYLGTNTTFSSPSIGGFWNSAKSFGSDLLSGATTVGKTVGSAYLSASLLNGGQQPQYGYGFGSDSPQVSALPYNGGGLNTHGGTTNGESILSNLVPIIMIGAFMLVATKIVERT